MARTSESGVTRAGILFIIVAVILAVLVFAGIYWVKQRGEQVRRDDAVEVAQENLEEASDDPVVIGEEEQTDEQEQTGTTGAGQQNQPTPGQVATTGVSVLPETGAEPVHVIAVSLLAGTAVAYVSSRKAARQH